MPPKNNARDKGKGKGKDKQKVVVVEPFNPCDELKPGALVAGRKPPTDDLDDETKETYQVQIDDCQEKLEILQRRADELTIKAQFYPQLFEQQDFDTKDLSLYLEKCLKEKEDTLATVKAEHKVFANEKQEQSDEQQKQLEELRIEIDEMKQKISDDNAAKQVQLNAMKEVDEDRQEINDEISSRLMELNARQELNKEKIYQQERNATMAIEHLRRSAKDHIGTVAKECTKAAEKQLRATVKQCTIDSVRATAKIAAKFSDESISRLLSTNDALRRRTEENQRMIEILEANRDVLNAENQRQRQVTDVLVQKMKSYEPPDLDFRYQQTDREILRQLDFMKDFVDDERKCLINATQRRQTLQKTLDKVNAEVKSTAVINQDLYDILTAAAPGLKEILPSSNVDLLWKLDMLTSDDAYKAMEPTPPSRQLKLHLPKRKTTRNCIEKST